MANDYCATTHWSVVLSVRDSDPRRAADALGRLCQTYWYPIYSSARRAGDSHHEAEDLTQSFLAHILGRSLLAGVSPTKGKFRSFLLTSFRHFKGNEHRRRQAIKRGGDTQVVSIDESLAEEWYAHEPETEADDGRRFDRSWAIAVLEEAYGLLRHEYEAFGQQAMFTWLSAFLPGKEAGPSYAQTRRKRRGLGSSCEDAC